MYKLAIIDDNLRDRRGVQSLLDWTGLGIEVIGSYPNGMAFLEELDKLDVDIIITDVIMPAMNGIELSHAVRQKHPDIKILFMSAYNEFDFAKSAIELNAYGYVLKPIIRDEFTAAIQKILAGLEAENNAREEKKGLLKQLQMALPSYQEQFFRDLLFSEFKDFEHIQDYLCLFNINLPVEQYFAVATFQAGEQAADRQGSIITDNYLISLSIKQLFNEIREHGNFIILIQLNHDTYTGIFGGAQDRLVDLVISCKDKMNEKLQIKTIMGVSKTVAGLEKIGVLYNQSIKAMNTRFYRQSDTLVLFEEIENRQEDILDNFNIKNLTSEINEIISCGSDDEINKFIEKYIPDSRLQKGDKLIKSFAFSVITITGFVLSEANVDPGDFFVSQNDIFQNISKPENLSQIKSSIFKILKLGAKSLLAQTGGCYEKVVDKIKEIIREKYSEKISVNDIAEYINFSPTHANNIFKNITGETIFEYLTSYRIEKAKSLLKDPYAKVYLIAEEVGYNNKSHFCLKFKQYTGLSPTEYKNKAYV